MNDRSLKMKKTAFLISTLLIFLFLAACQATKGSSTTQAAGGGVLSNAQSSQWTQLAVGTLMLDQTNYPVDAAQAAELLPLWKGARSLNNSETSAAAEVAGLLKQIQTTLTSDQFKAIQALDLSPQNLPAAVQQLGIQTGSLGQTSKTTSASGTGGMSGGPGGAPPGDFGSMPGGPGGGGPSSAQTTQVASGGESTSLGVSSDLLEEVIKYLKAKLQ
jgi:hypothetical protein